MAGLTVEQAAKHIGCSRSRLDHLRVEGGGPLYTKIGREVRYQLADLEAWLEMQKRASTSEPARRAVRLRRRRAG